MYVYHFIITVSRVTAADVASDQPDNGVSGAVPAVQAPQERHQEAVQAPGEQRRRYTAAVVVCVRRIARSVGAGVRTSGSQQRPV